MIQGPGQESFFFDVHSLISKKKKRTNKTKLTGEIFTKNYVRDILISVKFLNTVLNHFFVFIYQKEAFYLRNIQQKYHIILSYLFLPIMIKQQMKFLISLHL